MMDAQAADILCMVCLPSIGSLKPQQLAGEACNTQLGTAVQAHVCWRACKAVWLLLMLDYSNMHSDFQQLLRTMTLCSSRMSPSEALGMLSTCCPKMHSAMPSG